MVQVVMYHCQLQVSAVVEGQHHKARGVRRDYYTGSVGVPRRAVSHSLSVDRLAVAVKLQEMTQLSIGPRVALTRLSSYHMQDNRLHWLKTQLDKHYIA